MDRGIITIIVIIFVLNFASIGIACTGFTTSDDNKVLVGMNEDNYSTRRYVEIYSPEEGKFGKIFFCYVGYGIQQMMNDQGLFWDGFWAPHLDIQNGEGKPRPDSWISDWMDDCSTVNEIIDIYNSYDWRNTGIEDAMLFFVDRLGNSAIIEGDEIVYKEGNHQVVTNFYQTHPELGGFGFNRYDTAVYMLENMEELTMEYFRDICQATGQYSTIYSIVCNLTTNLIHYYYDGNFNDVWEIDLNEEFEFDTHTHDVLDIFNNHNPVKPFKPNGPDSGKPGEEYEFSCTTIDIDGDQLYYKWDWGDGIISNWIGPYNTGESCKQSHKWSEKGEYHVKVRVRDENCGKSEWSESLVVTMSKNKKVQFSLIKWFLQRIEVFFPLLKMILGGDL